MKRADPYAGPYVKQARGDGRVRVNQEEPTDLARRAALLAGRRVPSKARIIQITHARHDFLLLDRLADLFLHGIKKLLPADPDGLGVFILP